MDNAIAGIEKLRTNVDTLIVIPNDRVLEMVTNATTMADAFKMADQVLQQGGQGVTDLINNPGMVNLDFADLCTVMRDKGVAHIGIGYCNGNDDERCLRAVQEAISSPLLETSIEGATDVIFNIAGRAGMKEVNAAAIYVKSIIGPNANVIFGTSDENRESDEITITIIATGMDEGTPAAPAPSRQPQPTQQPRGLGFLSGQSRPAAPAAGRTQAPTAAYEKPIDVYKTSGQSAAPVSRQPQAPAPQPQAQPETGGIKIPDFLKNKGNR